MTGKITVRDSVPDDIVELAVCMRDKDKLEAERLGHDPVSALVYSYSQGIVRRTALVNGKVAAMWGVAGQVTSDKGEIYFITGTPVYEVSPIRFARLYKQQLHEMNNLFPYLENYVDSSYTESVRLLKLCGFTLDEPGPLGFQRFYMKKEN